MSHTETLSIIWNIAGAIFLVPVGWFWILMWAGVFDK